MGVHRAARPQPGAVLAARPVLPHDPDVSELAPGFLVAVPQMGDANFARAVVLLLEHGPNGALGIVVNRPGPLRLAEVARTQGFPRRPVHDRAPVFVGGPVQPDRGFLLHDRTDVDERLRVLDGLYVSSSTDTLKALLEADPARFRLCLGYSGWGPGQLEKELRDGAWVATEALATHVLRTPASDAWTAVLADLGIDPAMMGRGGGLH